VLLVLAIVALLAWATIYIIKKNNLRMEKTGEEITINSVKIISGDKKLIMVRAKNKEYLLAISSAGIILIDSFSNDKGAGKRIKK
jgi:competence protein ComGC